MASSIRDPTHGRSIQRRILGILMQSPPLRVTVDRLILGLTLFAGRIGRFVTRNRTSIQTVAGTIALALGFWGWTLQNPPSNFWGVLDNLFRTAQLITLQFPTNFSGPIPVPLQIARLAVPTVAVLASFQVLVSSITRPARLALLPHTAGHLVVCGSDSLTESALTTLASRGRQVVIVAPKIKTTRREMLEGLGLTVVERDPLQSMTIKSLHLSHAAALFLTADDDMTNLNIAMLALSASGARPANLPPLVLAVLIDNEILAVEIDKALDGLSRRYGMRYQRLCPARESIRLELARFAPVQLKQTLDLPSHVLVVGLTGNWQPLVAQIIAATQDHPEKNAVLTFIVDDTEAEAVKLWHETNPELNLVVNILILRRQAAALLPSEDVVELWRKANAAPQLAVVLRGNTVSIATALALRRPGNSLGIDAIPVLVHQSKEDRVLDHLGSTLVRGRDMTRLIAIGGLVRAESIERILDRRGDDMAIALHSHYLDSAETPGAGSPAALEAWDDLSENLRDANRAAAEHIPILFAAAGFRLAPIGPGYEPVTLSIAELECLARIEHRRWIADRIDRGWRYGKIRDDRLMLHPALVPFEALRKEERKKDRDAVQALLSVLGTQGLMIVRSEVVSGN